MGLPVSFLLSGFPVFLFAPVFCRFVRRWLATHRTKLVIFCDNQALMVLFCRGFWVGWLGRRHKKRVSALTQPLLTLNLIL